MSSTAFPSRVDESGTNRQPRRGFREPPIKKLSKTEGGDLPSIYAAPGGSARADFFAVGITPDTGVNNSLFYDDGSAIIVHEKPGPYGEEESDTGSRLACGVIRPK